MAQRRIDPSELLDDAPAPIVRRRRVDPAMLEDDEAADLLPDAQAGEYERLKQKRRSGAFSVAQTLAMLARVGAPIAGGAIGSLFGGVGAVPGAVAGGSLGEYIAERIERDQGQRSSINPYQVGGQGLLNAIPIPGSSSAVRAVRAASGAAKGYAVGVGSSAATSLLEGETPDWGNMKFSGGVGAGVGGALSAALPAMARRGARRALPDIDVPRVPRRLAEYDLEPVDPDRLVVSGPTSEKEPLYGKLVSWNARRDAPRVAAGHATESTRWPVRTAEYAPDLGPFNQGVEPDVTFDPRAHMRGRGGPGDDITAPLPGFDSGSVWPDLDGPAPLTPQNQGGPPRRPPSIGSGIDRVRDGAVDGVAPPPGFDDGLDDWADVSGRDRPGPRNQGAPPRVPAIGSGIDRVRSSVDDVAEPPAGFGGGADDWGDLAGQPTSLERVRALGRALRTGQTATLLDGPVPPGGKPTGYAPSSQNDDADDLIAQLGAGDGDLEISDPFASSLNGSGESAASLEALSRQRGMQARGEQFVVYDRAGNRKPLIGPDAVDYAVRPGESYGVEGPNGFRLLDDAGGRPPAAGTPRGTDVESGGTPGRLVAEEELTPQSIDAEPAGDPAGVPLPKREGRETIPAEIVDLYGKLLPQWRATKEHTNLDLRESLLEFARRTTNSPKRDLMGAERKLIDRLRALGKVPPLDGAPPPAAAAAAPELVDGLPVGSKTELFTPEGDRVTPPRVYPEPAEHWVEQIQSLESARPKYSTLHPHAKSELERIKQELQEFGHEKRRPIYGGQEGGAQSIEGWIPTQSNAPVYHTISNGNRTGPQIIKAIESYQGGRAPSPVALDALRQAYRELGGSEAVQALNSDGSNLHKLASRRMLPQLHDTPPRFGPEPPPEAPSVPRDTSGDWLAPYKGQNIQGLVDRSVSLRGEIDAIDAQLVQAREALASGSLERPHDLNQLERRLMTLESQRISKESQLSRLDRDMQRMADEGVDPSDLGGSESGFANPALLAPIAGAATGAVLGPMADPENPGAGAVGGAFTGAALGALGSRGGRRTLERMRYAGLLSGMAVPKSILGNLGAMGAYGAERGKMGTVARQAFSPATGRAFTRAWKDTPSREVVAGGLGGPLGLPGRVMGTFDATARDVLQRSGASEDEAAQMVLMSHPKSKAGKSLAETVNGDDWSSTAVRQILPFSRTATNTIERGLERLPGLGGTDAIRDMTGASKGLAKRRQFIGGLAILGGAAVGSQTADGGMLEDHKWLAPFATAAMGPYALPAALGTASGFALGGGGDLSDVADSAGGAAAGLLPIPHEWSLNPRRYLRSLVPYGSAGRFIAPVSPDELDTSNSLFGPAVSQIPYLNEALLPYKRRALR